MLLVWGVLQPFAGVLPAGLVLLEDSESTISPAHLRVVLASWLLNRYCVVVWCFQDVACWLPGS